MVTVNSISATLRGSMGRGLSSLEPGERRAQRSASTPSPSTISLSTVLASFRFSFSLSIRASIFLLPLSFHPFYLIVSVILFTTSSFSLQNPFPLFLSIILCPVFFLLPSFIFFLPSSPPPPPSPLL